MEMSCMDPKKQPEFRPDIFDKAAVSSKERWPYS